MSTITTHVLDTVPGKPAAGVTVLLERSEGHQWNVVSSGITDRDGRCRDLAQNAKKGVYRLTFVVGSYLARKKRASIYPLINVTFTCTGKGHYHLPLLLSDNSYTTYRGS